MRRILIAVLAVLWTHAAAASCNPANPAGIPFDCTAAAAVMQNGDVVLGGEGTSTVKFSYPQLMGADHSISPVTAAGSGMTNSLATWMGYLSGGVPIPWPMLFDAQVTIDATLAMHPANVTASSPQSSGYLMELDETYSLSSAATSGIYFGIENNFTVNGNPQGAQVWHNFDRMFEQTASSATGGVVNRYIQDVRGAGYGKTTGLTMWGMIIEMREQTGLPTSQSGGVLGLEMDMAVNGAADVPLNRQLLVLTLLNGTGTGAAPEGDCAVCIFGQDGALYGDWLAPIFLGTQFANALIDMRQSTLKSGATGHDLWLPSGGDIAFDTGGSNVLAFSATANALEYSQGGSLVLSANTAGVNAHYLLGAYAGLSLDTSNLNQIVYNAGSNSVQFKQNGTLAMSVNSGGIGVFGLFNPETVTVGTEPSVTAVNKGALAFVSDCRNAGEGAGGGSGCLAFVNDSGAWHAVWSGAAVTN